MGQDKPRKAEPKIQCPDCGKMCHTLTHLHHHRSRTHPDTYTTGIKIRQPVGIPIRYKLSGNAPVPQENQAKSWKSCDSNVCPACKRIFPDVALCRRHWSGTCSNPLAKKCKGCQLLMKTAAKASWKLKGTYKKFTLIPERIRKKAWTMHTCLRDRDKAPDIARRSYLMKKRLMPQAKILDPSVATFSRSTAASPRPLHYKLLPTHTVRRRLRAPFRIITGKCTM